MFVDLLVLIITAMQLDGASLCLFTQEVRFVAFARQMDIASQSTPLHRPLGQRE